jgi:formate dehydrogenase major subunit
MEQIKITINEKEISVNSEITILEAVHQNKIDEIPTLCHDKRLEHFTSCFLCVVEVEGMNKLIPACSTKVSSGMKIHTKSESVFESRRTALALLMSNHYADCIGPCTNNCPAGVDAQTYIALISMGKYKEALKLVKENNPLPLSIGRVCVRDCEAACRRKFIDEPVSVNALKRFIADYDNVNKWTPPIKQKNGKNVAIIGGGPAGLSCAYYLTIEGYSVTIFEKLPKLGGMLRYGIPEYRLPKKILDSEINWILNLGVEVQTGVELGVDFSMHSLFENGFDSVFVGVGAHKASKMGLTGEDITYGIFRGIDFLREVELSFIPELDGTVVVVGGGNTAIDAARTALRCGADKVKIVYRRSIKEMPASPEEVEAAQKEGIEVLFLTNPKSIISEDHKLKAIECLKMGLVEGKPGERAKPVQIEGSEFIINCDYLISAIGQSVDNGFTKFDRDCTLEKWGTVCVNKETMETSIPGVFAGGDVVTGPLTAITSIAQGKKAAKAIMNYLTSGKAKNGNGKFYSFKHNLTKINEREFEGFRKLAREKMKELEVTDRIHSFREVEKGLNEDQVLGEIKRCLECGCSEYYDCQLRKYCDEYNVNISEFIGETKKYLADGRHPFISLDPNKCVNCGRCVRTCSEILKVSALGFINRGFKSVVKPAMEKALSETNCVSCGNCIDACPTGAISEKFPFKILGTLPKENLETICSFCSVGCKLNFKKVSDDIFYVSNTTEEIKDSHNRGYLCVKGRFGHRYLMNKNRVVYPQIRKHGIIDFVNTTEAIKYSEKQIRALIEKYGRDSIAVFASPKLSNEELYLLQKFTRIGLKNNNISSFSNLVFDTEQGCLDSMTGFTSSTVSMDDLKDADVIVVVNSNLSEENLVMELKIKEAQKRGAKLVLMNSSEIILTKYADLWVDSRKGTNTYLIDSVNKSIIEERFIDEKFINDRSTNFNELKTELSSVDISNAINYSGIDRTKFEAFVSLMKNPLSNIIFIYNIDSRSDKSINDLKAVSNFLMLTGRIGKEKNGIIILREFNNSTGLIDMGVIPAYLPGYVKYEETEEIEKIGKAWNADLTNIFKPVDLAVRIKKGEIKGMLIFGEDPLNGRENAKYFNGVEFLLVSDAYHTNTTDEADVVLPAANHIEQSGTYTRCDNKVQKSSKVVNGLNEYENWQLISKLATGFAGGFMYNSSVEIFDEIKKINRFYKHSGINKSWMKEYFNNGFTTSKLHFSVHQADFTTFDNLKHIIHYQDNYYFSSVKNKLE